MEFSAEDATRSDPDFLVAVVEAVVEAGATTVNLPDTVGYATPDEIVRFFRTVRARVKGADRVVFSAHCHNDLGLAVANSLAALEGGCRQLECTVNGIGERAGNASLEEIVMTLRVRPDKLPFTTGIATHGALRRRASSSRRSRAKASSRTRPSWAATPSHTRPASTRTASSRTAGRTRSCARRTSAFRETTLVLGKHSGRHALKNRCAALRIEPTRLELDELYKRMIALADRKKIVRDDDLFDLWSAMKRAPRAKAPVLRLLREEAAPAEEAGYGHGV